MEKTSIGKFISALRRASGMTQRELADRLFVSDKTVSRWERDECAPDISLIPIIADIFGVTSDEIIRGERTSSKPTSESPESAQYQRKKSLRQFNALLSNRQKRTKNLNLIALGVALIGVICALICNFAFTRASLGFWLGCIFFAGAVIMIICVTNSARLATDEDEDAEKLTAIKDFNNACVMCAISSVRAVAIMLGAVLPFAAVGAYLGIVFSSYIALCLITVASTVCISTAIIYIFVLPVLIRSGAIVAGEVQSAMLAYKKKLLCRMSVALAITAVAALVGVGVVQSLPTSTFAKEYKFETYEEFVQFVAVLNLRDGYYDEDVMPPKLDVSVKPMPDTSIGDGKENGSSSLDMEYIYDEDRNVLCEYERTDHISSIRFSFASSPEDGLPIYVTTTHNVRAANSTVSAISTAVSLVPLLAALVMTAIYLRAVRVYRSKR